MANKIACSVDGCDNPVKSKGLCEKHYQRLWKTGTLTLKYPAKGEPVKWLEGMVANPPDDCVLWPFSIDAHTGYGAVSHNGKRMTAHRLALILATGENPKDKLAAHGPCHNRPCCNPRHLSWKTTKENFADKLRDGTHNRGSRHGIAKLNEQQVLNIFADKRLHNDIAKDYGVSRSVVSSIKNRFYWTWLTDGKEPNTGKPETWDSATETIARSDGSGCRDDGCGESAV